MGKASAPPARSFGAVAEDGTRRTPGPHAAPLLEGAAKGALMVQRCPACGHVPGFPRVACPRCLGELVWREAAGRGRVRTFTVIRRSQHRRFADHLPIVMALIELEEGTQVISTILGEDRLDTAIGSAVAATRGGWSTLPQFRLVQD
jgi:uncharacterized protein